MNRISASVHVRCLLLSGQSLDDISCFSRLGICLATGIHDGLHQQRRSNAPLGVALICRYRDRQSRVLGGPCAPTWLRLCLAKIHKENRFEGVRVHLGTSARGLAGTGGRLLLLHEAVAPQSGYRYKHLDGVLRHDSGYPRLGYPRESPTFLHISADYHEGQLHLWGLRLGILRYGVSLPGSQPRLPSLLRNVIIRLLITLEHSRTEHSRHMCTYPYIFCI